jgi:uncharacterized membrane protein
VTGILGLVMTVLSVQARSKIVRLPSVLSLSVTNDDQTNAA